SHKSLDDQPDDNELEKGVTRRTWKKRPRTFDWVLNASAPGGPVSINLLRGYRGHVACDIWENNTRNKLKLNTLGGIKLTKIRELLEKKSNIDDTARGYLVTLLGSTLFIDKTVDRASTLLFSLTTDLVGVKTYSWASATLAHLYRELGKASRAECAQLAGPSTLLEAWIYEHFPMFRPSLNSNFIPDSHPRAMRWDIHTSTPKLTSSLKAHRRRLDDMKVEEVIWLPYGSNVADNFPLSLYHGCIRYCSTIERTCLTVFYGSLGMFKLHP
ncbi:Protein MAIN-LIKE 2, partial [Bienertia sinuspersici]